MGRLGIPACPIFSPALTIVTVGGSHTAVVLWLVLFVLPMVPEASWGLAGSNLDSVNHHLPPEF